jgi:hypothetical protein
MSESLGVMQWNQAQTVRTEVFTAVGVKIVAFSGVRVLRRDVLAPCAGSVNIDDLRHSEGFWDLTVMTTEIAVFCDATPYSLVRVY